MFDYGTYRGSIAAAALLSILAWVLLSVSHSHRSCETVVRVPQLKHEAPQTQVSRSKVDEFAIKLQRYGNEAYPAWLKEHPGRKCPDSIDELNKYIGAIDSLDRWGRPMKVVCDRPLPRFPGFSVVSAGQDGKMDTEDDVEPF